MRKIESADSWFFPVKGSAATVFAERGEPKIDRCAWWADEYSYSLVYNPQSFVLLQRHLKTAPTIRFLCIERPKASKEREKKAKAKHLE